MVPPTWCVVQLPSGLLHALGNGKQVHNPYREALIVWQGDAKGRNDAMRRAHAILRGDTLPGENN